MNIDDGMDKVIEAWEKLKSSLPKEVLWEIESNTLAEKEAVNSPAHYNGEKYECIDVMVEAIGLEDTKGFCLCNAFKYIWRCTKKHNTPTEDVKKAIWYLQKFLELESETENV